MKPMTGPLIALVLAASMLLAPAAAFSQSQRQLQVANTTAEVNPGFRQWLEDLGAKARARGISQETLDNALNGLRPDPKVGGLDDRQPEFVLTFGRYLNLVVSKERVTKGRQMLTEHRGLLDKISREYGVQAKYLVAFWGAETNFGGFTGGHQVIAALATLAYEGRRTEFFTEELLKALLILDQGHIALNQMKGSWAGAMGQMQFMPSTFLGYAVDYDGDGRKDIWNNLGDAFASAANYLRALNWRGDERWGRQVLVSPTLAWESSGLSNRQELAAWSREGVTRINGDLLPQADMEASVLLPSGHKGPAFLVYGNFRAIFQWNRSLFYALAIGHLADRISGSGPLVGMNAITAEEPLSTDEAKEVQARLNGLGFAAGKPDGKIGPKTRAALRAFHRGEGLPADGYPDKAVLQSLRKRGA